MRVSALTLLPFLIGCVHIHEVEYQLNADASPRRTREAAALASGLNLEETISSEDQVTEGSTSCDEPGRERDDVFEQKALVFAVANRMTIRFCTPLDLFSVGTPRVLPTDLFASVVDDLLQDKVHGTAERCSKAVAASFSTILPSFGAIFSSRAHPRYSFSRWPVLFRFLLHSAVDAGAGYAIYAGSRNLETSWGLLLTGLLAALGNRVASVLLDLELVENWNQYSGAGLPVPHQVPRRVVLDW